MSETAIELRVIRRGDRADELLAQLARRLERTSLEPDRTGAVIVRIPKRGPQAWDNIRETLDELGPDWRQWLHLSPRPRR